MFKYIYTIIPVVLCDLLLSCAMILVYQENTGFVIMVNSIVRPLYVGFTLILFSYILDLISLRNRLLFFVLLFSLSYLSIILFIFFSKGNNDSFAKTFIDFHYEWILYSSILLPYTVSFWLVVFFQRRMKSL